MSAYHKEALQTGSTLAEYTIDSVLGHGGFGITYLAKDTALGANVAIKEYLPAEIATREEGSATVVPKLTREAVRDYQWGLKNFVKEARALARFKHPNIVRVLRFLEANGTAYMVMEYEDGKTLAHHLKQAGRRLDERDLLRIVMPILNGLHAVHEAGMLHLDIKPENIYLRHDGNPMLIDFGSARQAMAKSGHGRIALTHGYAPVEQYPDKGTLGPWSDVYALGATMYRCVTGKRPESALERYRAILDYKVDPLKPATKAVKKGYTPLMLECIDWAMQSHAKDRPRTARELQDALMGRARPNRASAATAAVTAAPPARPTAARTSVIRGARSRAAHKPYHTRPQAWIALGLAVAGLLLWAVRDDLLLLWQSLGVREGTAREQQSPPQDRLSSSEPSRRATGPTPARAAPRPEKRGPAAVPSELHGVFDGHGDWVQSLAFAPGGRRLASAGSDRTIRIWDVRAGRPLATLSQGYSVNAVAYSPDGQWLAAAGADGVVRVWDAQTATAIGTFETHGHALYALAFSPDAKRLAAAGMERTIYVWDLTTGARERMLEGSRGEIYALAYTPDGKSLVSAGSDRVVRFWDARSGEEAGTLAGHRDTVLALALSADGRSLATGDAGNSLRVWDTRDFSLRHTIGAGHAVLAVAFDRAGTWVAVGTAGNTVRIYGTEDGRLRQVLEGHRDYVQAVAMAADGPLLASGSRDRSIRLWQPP